MIDCGTVVSGRMMQAFAEQKMQMGMLIETELVLRERVWRLVALR